MRASTVVRNKSHVQWHGRVTPAAPPAAPCPPPPPTPALQDGLPPGGLSRQEGAAQVRTGRQVAEREMVSLGGGAGRPQGVAPRQGLPAGRHDDDSLDLVGATHLPNPAPVCAPLRSHNQRVLWVGGLHESVTNEVGGGGRGPVTRWRVPTNRVAPTPLFSVGPPWSCRAHLIHPPGRRATHAQTGLAHAMQCMQRPNAVESAGLAA